ncbi:MAG TPA: aldo/keto reductase [Myxococcota bacterium]|nr:aldo/keto reductase [Myxococcota bacterium]
MPRPRTVVLAALAAALLLGFFPIGGTLYKTAIDLDAPAFPAGAAIQRAAEAIQGPMGRSVAGPFWFFGGLIAILLASFLAVRASVRAADAGRLDGGRRGFLRGAGAGALAAIAATATAGAGAWARAMRGVGNEGRGWGPVFDEIFRVEVAKTHPSYPDAWKEARVQAQRRLGRTGWPVSDIVVGAGRVSGEKGEAVVRLALERGVNYVDTSPDYSAAGSEEAIGRAIRGRRDDVFVATKFCSPRGHMGPGTSVAEYMGLVEASLRRLGTDRVDLVHVHSCDEVARLLDPNMHEAFDRLREQGKARFLGFSSHTPNLVQVAEAAIESGRFDVMMVAYHHGIWPTLPAVIERARRERDMGVVAMKTLKGARHRGLESFQAHADAYSQAALKWSLSNPGVSCAVISFFEFQHVDEYLRASGQRLTETDVALLEEYDRQIAGSYCAPHCGACLDHCPEQLAIHDVLRYRMYFEDYGNEKEALRLYGALAKNASVCASCSAPCLGSCPVGIPIQGRMRGAHELLSLELG